MAILACFCSCTGGKVQDSDTWEEEDTLWQGDYTGQGDTLLLGEEELARPESENLAFFDFFFTFLRNKSFQAAHIKFPLPLVDLDSTVTTITSGAAFRSYFRWPADDDYYTLLLTDLRQMEELESSLQLDSVSAEVIDLDAMTMRTYDFLRRDSVWQLRSSRTLEPTGRLGDFLTFYAQFSRDTLFQQERLAEHIRFSSADPDDETGLIEGILLPSQWPAFRPALPGGVITNFSFGQPFDEAGSVILLQGGMASSMMQTLTFQQKHGRWLLTSFDD
ncbi:MAG: DUF4348 domain-containing protein [Prevotellaceae bacterium]|nr:DUF4348 domain-containing protein [Prevotellaceae bacterium]